MIDGMYKLSAIVITYEGTAAPCELCVESSRGSEERCCDTPARRVEDGDTYSVLVNLGETKPQQPT